jgi:hypothetical protein
VRTWPHLAHTWFIVRAIATCRLPHHRARGEWLSSLVRDVLDEEEAMSVRRLTRRGRLRHLTLSLPTSSFRAQQKGWQRRGAMMEIIRSGARAGGPC